jgi:hypothetical protein
MAAGRCRRQRRSLRLCCLKGQRLAGLGGKFLFTLKFNDAGNWKIIEGHDMSEKEVEEIEKGE